MKKKQDVRIIKWSNEDYNKGVYTLFIDIAPHVFWWISNVKKFMSNEEKLDCFWELFYRVNLFSATAQFVKASWQTS